MTWRRAWIQVPDSFLAAAWTPTQRDSCGVCELLHRQPKHYNWQCWDWSNLNSSKMATVCCSRIQWRILSANWEYYDLPWENGVLFYCQWLTLREWSAISLPITHLERMKHYFTANDSPWENGAIFHCQGYCSCRKRKFCLPASVARQCRDFAHSCSNNTKSFWEWNRTLKSHFVLKHCNITEQFHFHWRRQ